MLGRALQFVLGLGFAPSAAPPSPANNSAAWITGPQAWPFVVGDAAYPTPLASEIIVKSAAVAINPVDWKIQYGTGFSVPYPYVLGEDVAGEVVQVGSGVDIFKTGDRVAAFAAGIPVRAARNGAFQLYVAVPAVLAAKIPDALTYAEAAVLPLGLATAAAGLFQSGYLELPLPAADSAQTPPGSGSATNRVVLVWGGSSSVGTSAIQLAAAVGVRIATTASPRNHAYVKSLGAEWAFDYNSDTVVDDIVAALEGLELVGVYDAIGDNKTQNAGVEIIKGLEKETTAKVVTVIGRHDEFRDGVRVLGLSAADIGTNEVGSAIFNDFLPTALETGQILPKPDPWVIAKGLSGIQKGVDELRQGVSAQKIVVLL